jgi:hypothetical protein
MQEIGQLRFLISLSLRILRDNLLNYTLDCLLKKIIYKMTNYIVKKFSLCYYDIKMQDRNYLITKI